MRCSSADLPTTISLLNDAAVSRERCSGLQYPIRGSAARCMGEGGQANPGALNKVSCRSKAVGSVSTSHRSELEMNKGRPTCSIATCLSRLLGRVTERLSDIGALPAGIHRLSLFGPTATAIKAESEQTDNVSPNSEVNRRTSRRYLAAIAMAFLLLLPAHSAVAQTAGPSMDNGGNFPSVQTANPSNAYGLSNIEQYSPYTGAVSLLIPLYYVGGRGNAGYQIYATIATHWSINKALNADGSVMSAEATVDTLPTWNNEPLTLTAHGSVVTSGVCAAGTAEAGGPMVIATLTRYSLSWNDGSTVTLRDQAQDGQPVPFPKACSYTGSTGTRDAGRGLVAVSRDGSHLLLTLSSAIQDPAMAHTSPVAGPTTGTLYTSAGIKYSVSGGLATSMEDTNGNQISFTPATVGTNNGLSYQSITDSLGRTISFSNGNIQYPRPGGGTGQVQVIYAPLGSQLRPGDSLQNYSALFPSLKYNPDSQFNPSVIASIKYNDGSSYTFLYNRYAEIARVTLPTGGAIEYDYASGNPATPDGTVGDPYSNTYPMLVYRRVEARRVYSATGSLQGTTTYTWGSNSSTDWYSTERATDISNNVLSVRTTHFTSTPTSELNIGPTDYPPSMWGKANKVEEGSPVVRTTATLWNDASPSWCSTTNYCWLGAPDNNPTISEQDITLNDTNQQSKITYQYDQYNNVTDKKEYDWGSGQAGALLRETQTQYEGSPYTGLNILNLPSVQTTLDARGNIVAETNYGYDQYNSGSTGPLNDASGIVGHDSDYGTSFTTRGNLTNPAQCLNPPNCTNWVNHVRDYDIAGNVVRQDDGNGNHTWFTYNDDGSNEYAFATSIQNAYSQITHVTYDYNVGKPTSVTDANGVETRYSFNDNLDRLTQINRAVGTSAETHTNIQYTSSTDVNIYSDQTSAGQSDQLNAGLHSETIYDGFGRVSQTLRYRPDGCADRVMTTYDALGRKYTISNPSGHCGSGADDGLNYLTFYSYDALSRLTSITHTSLTDPTQSPSSDPAAASASTNYSGNVSTTMDEAGHARTTTSDALGRIVKVVEDPSSSGLNYSTVYSYDALDDLTCVNQGAFGANGTCDPSQPHARSFAYDSLKRLIWAKNPESGLTCYGTMSGSTCNESYDSNGNLLNKTDANGNVMSDSYDALNRLTAKSFSGSNATPSASFTYCNGTSNCSNIPYSVGRLQTTSNSNSTANYTGYDALGRVTGQELFPTYTMVMDAA